MPNPTRDLADRFGEAQPSQWPMGTLKRITENACSAGLWNFQERMQRRSVELPRAHAAPICVSPMGTRHREGDRLFGRLPPERARLLRRLIATDQPRIQAPKPTKRHPPEIRIMGQNDGPIRIMDQVTRRFRGWRHREQGDGGPHHGSSKRGMAADRSGPPRFCAN